MNLRWTWPRRAAQDTLVIARRGADLVYAAAGSNGQLHRHGIAERGSDSPAEFARRLRGLGLPGAKVGAVLALDQAQLLQVDAPAVRPEEMKAAARWKVKDLVGGRIDEMTIDVMYLGDERPRAGRQVFVAAAANETIRRLVEDSRAAGLDLGVIDICETAQRNLQSALAERQGLGGRAHAALVRYGGQGLLTICAAGELFYARRLEWEDLAAPSGVAAAATVTPIAEMDLGNVDFVDYGAEAAGAQDSGDQAPRLVVEVQRSVDLWERSWPDLPLAAVWVQAGAETAALQALLQTALAQPVQPLDLQRIFPGLDPQAAGLDPETLLPVLGALLRQDTRKL